MGQVWSEVVEEFLELEFVRTWLGKQHAPGLLGKVSLDLGKKLRLLLELSRNKLMAHGADERKPSFLAYDAMTYLAFFPDGDPLGRDHEWWTGGGVARRSSRAQTR